MQSARWTSLLLIGLTAAAALAVGKHGAVSGDLRTDHRHPETYRGEA